MASDISLADFANRPKNGKAWIDDLPDEIFNREFKTPVTDGSGNVRKQLRIAKKLLEEAGWQVKDRQLVKTESGEAMKFEILLISPAFERIVLPFSKNLEILGIKTSIRVVDGSIHQPGQGF